MNASPFRSNVSKHSSKPGARAILVLLLVALAMALIAVSALAAGGNLVKNGSFEGGTHGIGIPNHWDDFSIVIDPKRVCNQSYVGECSLKVFMDGEDKLVQQLIYVDGNDGDTFKLGLWVKRKELVWGSGSLRIGFFFHRPDTSVEPYFYYLNAGTVTWTHFVYFPSATQDFDYMYIHILSDADSGKAWFDKVRLVEVP